MAWNWIHLDVRPVEADIIPTYGPGGMSREEAHAQVQKKLDQRSAFERKWAEMSAVWKRGAQDDRVHSDTHTFAIFEYPTGGDFVTASQEIVQDHVTRIHKYTGHKLPVIPPVIERDGKAPGSDPVEGVYGQLVINGWIGQSPDGDDFANLLLATPDERAPHTMPLVAEALGINPQPGSMTTEPTNARVCLDGGLWITLDAGDAGRHPGRVSEEWEQVARDRGRVLLSVAYRPLPPNADVFEFVEALGREASQPDGVVLSLAPVTGTR